MSADSTPTNADRAGSDAGRDGFTPPVADRPPTAEEAAAADRAAADIDLEVVAEQYEGMIERGANVQGEGQVEPD
ncbi:MAG: hypothetical protein JWN99_703 [Ilumatobacteraceae bacterium]|nr:hypothetical protein [Ilumatobacteraceae bacterium]